VLTRSDASAKYYLYDRASGKATFWFDVRPALAQEKLSVMHPVEIAARDGLKLVSYYSLPLEADPAGSGKAAHPVPMVLFVHGGPWGRKMHDDLLDAVAWAVEHGITTRDKVAIMGGSYGGYATLAGLTMTPDEFACGVDIVGPSNLVTLLNSIPPYWASFRAQLTTRMGDPATEQDARSCTSARR